MDAGVHAADRDGPSRPRPARRATRPEHSDTSTAASANATAECPDTYPSPVARSRTRTRASTSTGRARAARCFTALAPQYAPWLGEQRRRRETRAPGDAGGRADDEQRSDEAARAASVPTRPATAGRAGRSAPRRRGPRRPGRRRSAMTTAQLPASNAAPPIAATTSPVRTPRRPIADPTRSVTLPERAAGRPRSCRDGCRRQDQPPHLGCDRARSRSPSSASA